jgi:hypothetical protein
MFLFKKSKAKPILTEYVDIEKLFIMLTLYYEQFGYPEILKHDEEYSLVVEATKAGIALKIYKE